MLSFMLSWILWIRKWGGTQLCGSGLSFVKLLKHCGWSWNHQLTGIAGAICVHMYMCACACVCVCVRVWSEGFSVESLHLVYFWLPHSLTAPIIYYDLASQVTYYILLNSIGRNNHKCISTFRERGHRYPISVKGVSKKFVNIKTFILFFLSLPSAHLKKYSQ